MIHKNRGNRRKQNYKKAIRKAKLIHEWGDYFTYPSLHALSKLKIHCSCPLCSGKTNTKKQKAKETFGEAYVKIKKHIKKDALLRVSKRASFVHKKYIF